MTSYDAQSLELDQLLAMHVARFGERLQRIRAEMDFANRLCAAHPNRTAEWQRLVLEAGRLLDAGLQAGNIEIDTLTADAEALLMPISETAKSYTLLAVGTHIST
jgi:hypothetical protein